MTRELSWMNEQTRAMRDALDRETGRLIEQPAPRQPTDMELRCAKAGYERAISTNIDFPITDNVLMHSWENQSDSLKEDWYSIVRAVIDELRNPNVDMLAAAELAPRKMRFPQGRAPAAVAGRQAIAALIYKAALNAASPPGNLTAATSCEISQTSATDCAP